MTAKKNDTTNWITRAKQVMHDRGVTQQDLAPVMGKTTRGAISHYFTGRSNPTLDQFESLATFLGISLTWLLTGAEESGQAKEVDDQLLEQCLTIVEEVLAENGNTLTSKQSAKMVAYLYSLAQDGERIDNNKVRGLIRLFA